MRLSDLISGGPTGQQGLGGILNRFINPTNPLGQLGKAIAQSSGGVVGDALTNLDQNQRQTQQDEMQRQLQQAQLQALQAKQGRGQFLPLQNGGVGFGDPDTGSFQMVQQPQAPLAKPTPLQENIGVLKQYNPNLSDADIAKIVERAIPGYAYSDEAVGVKNAADLAKIDRRVAGSLAVKRTPGGKAGGAPKTTMTRVVGGKPYYKIGGAWFDNPEGK